MTVDPRAGDEIEHRVAQEFKTLIVANLPLGMLIDVGWVGEGATQEVQVTKAMSQCLLEGLKVGDRMLDAGEWLILEYRFPPFPRAIPSSAVAGSAPGHRTPWQPPGDWRR